MVSACAVIKYGQVNAGICERAAIYGGVETDPKRCLVGMPHAGETTGSINPVYILYIAMTVLDGTVWKVSRGKKVIPPDEAMRHVEVQSSIALSVSPDTVSI
jgi:hypothetical protein